MNHFFAIELPDSARAQIAAFADRWKQQIDPAFHPRWYPPEDYHLTLKFLGDASEPLVSQAQQVAEENAQWHKPVVVAQKPFVAFPPLVKPHVLWVEVSPNSTLDLLAISLEREARDLGVKAEHRPFKPHITLARCRPGTDVPPFILGERAFGDFTATQFVLMRTLPLLNRADGAEARYNTVHTFPLGNGHI